MLPYIISAAGGYLLGQSFRRKFNDGGEVEPKLVALHNISPYKIIFADELGGLANPSIAILKEGEKYDDFGLITLIGDKNLIDPKNSDVQIFSGDVYSPTVPAKKYMLTKAYEKKARELVIKARSYELGSFVDNLLSTDTYSVGEFTKSLERLNKEEIVEKFTDLTVVYVIDQNIPFKIPMKDIRYYLANVDITLSNSEKKEFKRLQANTPALFSFMKKKMLSEIPIGEYDEKTTAFLKSHQEQMIEKIIGSEDHIFLNAYTKFLDASNGGKTIDFDKLKKNLKYLLKEDNYQNWLSDFIDKNRGMAYFEYNGRKYPYSLENLVEAMNDATRGAEKTLVYGYNKAKSFSLKQFYDVNQMKSFSHRLVSKKTMSEIDEENKQQFFDLGDTLEYKYANHWSKLDSLGKALADYFKTNDVKYALSKNGFSQKGKKDFIEYAEKLRNDPVDYFEVKFSRPVKLSEFQFAIVPKKTDKIVIDILSKNGIKIKYYSTYDERSAITNQVIKKEKLSFKKGGKI